MANMSRWTPRRSSLWDRDLFDEMDRIFEDPFFGRGSRGDNQNWGLPLDVAENENSYIIHASIPGIDPDDVDVSISDNVLTIRGELTGENTDENDRFVLRERRMGSFTRSVSFPMAVDAEHVEASCNNGVLTLRLPKAETARPRRINIGRGGRQTIEAQDVALGASGAVNSGYSASGATGYTTGGAQRSAGGGVRTERGAVGDSHGWPEGQAQTDLPATERSREGQGWTEGMATEREETAPQSGGWTEGQSETWDEKTPHSSGWTEGQRGSTDR